MKKDTNEPADLRQELEESIAALKKRIKEDQTELASQQLRLKELKKQEKERAHYISSREILDLIYQNTGKESNMSTIKRWADQGFLGDVIDEREVFWALKTKQGKKRYIYSKNQVYKFLYEKMLIKPKFDVLDRVRIYAPGQLFHGHAAVIVKSSLNNDKFNYTLQTAENFEKLDGVSEEQIKDI